VTTPGSFQIGDHFIARNADNSEAIHGIVVDIDKEYYHVDWGEWGKKQVAIGWVESLSRWTLTCRCESETINERFGN
jgi:hypothetical protein